jgi:hypothetical protein
MDSVLAFSYLGIPKSSQKIVPGATPTGLGANVLCYTQHVITFTSGGTAVIAAGDTIIGATSGATADVVSVTLASGSWAGGDAAGTLTIKNSVGTWGNNEKLKTRAGTDDATMTGTPAADTSDYPFKGAVAKAALVQATVQSALMTLDGTNPDTTYDKGIVLPANNSYQLVGADTLRNFRVIDATAASATTVNVILFYSGQWSGPA